MDRWLRTNKPVSSLDDLVIQQERMNKKSRARLHPSSEERVSEWIGLADLTTDCHKREPSFETFTMAW